MTLAKEQGFAEIIWASRRDRGFTNSASTPNDLPPFAEPFTHMCLFAAPFGRSERSEGLSAGRKSAALVDTERESRSTLLGRSIVRRAISIVTYISLKKQVFSS
jgi:hypothetical protein